MKALNLLLVALAITLNGYSQMIQGDVPLNLNRLGEKSGMIDSAYNRYVKLNGFRPKKNDETWKAYHSKNRNDLRIDGRVSAASAELLIGPATAITGAFLIDQLKKAAQGIIAQAGEEGKDVARKIAADLAQLEANIARDIKDLTKPITELDATIQETVQRTLVTVNQVMNFIDATRTCTRQDIKFLMDGLFNHIEQLKSNILPWKNYPVVTNIYERGSQTPYGITLGKPALLVLEGYDLESSPKCMNDYSVQIKNEQNVMLKARITGIGKNAIVIAIDTAKVAGKYTLNVVVCKKGFLGIGCKQARLTNVISVIKKPLIRIKYKITPSCNVTEAITFRAGEIHVVNESCDGNKYGGGTYSLPGDYTLTGFQFVETSQNGCRYDDPIRQVGDRSVTLHWTCPEKGGIFCTGAGKWVHGIIYLYGKHGVIQDGQEISGSYHKLLDYGQTVEIARLTDVGCSAAGWTVSVTLVYDDNSEHEIPSANADINGNIYNSNIEGASFYWNGNTKSLSVSTPAMRCPL